MAVSKILLDAGPSEAGWSKWETANRCLQLYALRHELGEEGLTHLKRGGEALTRGAIGHVGIAHHYARIKARKNGEDPDQFYTTEAAIRIAASSWGFEGDRWVDPVLDAMDDYCLHYGPEDADGIWPDDGLELLAVEEQMRGYVNHPDGDHLLYTQRGDLFVRDTRGMLIPGPGGTRGKICYLDHKYVGFLNNDTINRYALDGQFLGYTWFGRQKHGDEFGGAFLNLIEVSGGRTSRAPKKRFRRVPCPPSPEALAEFPQSIVDAGRHIEALKAEGRSPWKWPRRIAAGNCWNLWGPCPAYDYCRWGRKGQPGQTA